MKTRKKTCLRVLGYLFCVLPPAAATLEYFPLWIRRTDTAVSAFTVIGLFFCCVPFWKKLRSFCRSASAWKMWGGFFLILCLIRTIFDGMTAISFAGLLGSAVGEIFFAWANKGSKNEIPEGTPPLSDVETV